MKLIKDDEPPHGDIVDIDEKIPTDDYIADELAAAGFSKMTVGRLRLLEKLGVHQTGKGILKTQRGVAFLTQVRLNDTIEVLHSLLVEGVRLPKRKKGQSKGECQITTEDACRLAHEISFASGKLTESQELMNKLRPAPTYAPPPLPSDNPVTAAFPAQVLVGAGNNIQIVASPQKPVEKK